MKKIAVILAVLTCFAMISGSFASTYTNKNNGLDITNSFSHHLTICLPCNPSTGYVWTAKYDHSKVKLLREHYVPNIPILCGSGGFAIFTFVGEKGASVLMKYTSSDKCVSTKTYYIE